MLMPQVFIGKVIINTVLIIFLFFPYPLHLILIRLSLYLRFFLLVLLISVRFFLLDTLIVQTFLSLILQSHLYQLMRTQLSLPYRHWVRTFSDFCLYLHTQLRSHSQLLFPLFLPLPSLFLLLLFSNFSQFVLFWQ